MCLVLTCILLASHQNFWPLNGRQQKHTTTDDVQASFRIKSRARVSSWTTLRFSAVQAVLVELNIRTHAKTFNLPEATVHKHNLNRSLEWITKPSIKKNFCFVRHKARSIHAETLKNFQLQHNRMFLLPEAMKIQLLQRGNFSSNRKDSLAISVQQGAEAPWSTSI